MDAHYDLIVAGSGIAGLSAALEVARYSRVLLVTKGELGESNTRYAQGGIAAALGPEDAAELHRRDTLAAGDGLCDPAAVDVLTNGAEDGIEALLRHGVAFDREYGVLARTLEAAHSRPRVLHARGDGTGAEIARALSAAVCASSVTIAQHTVCTDLIVEHGRVTGVRLLNDDGSRREVRAAAVLLATGGAGQLFARTTNPAGATGDGLALAWRAGAALSDLEFMQFHPTALNLPGAPSFLISEAVRGEGGILRDGTGETFMARYHPARELAPRDVVARAIHQHMLETAGLVYLDVTHLDPALVERRFPAILAACRRHGVDPVREPIPVSPAAHYLMGGVLTDDLGRTTVPGLLAAGEAACTGVHGANRLASNSLLEGLVFARRAVHALLTGEGGPSGPRMPDYRARDFVRCQTGDGAMAVGRAALAEIFWRDASLMRSESSLRHAQDALAHLLRASNPESPAAIEAANLTLVAGLILTAALIRTESRGAHYRSDFPERDERWRGRIVLSREGIGLVPVTVEERVAAGVA